MTSTIGVTLIPTIPPRRPRPSDRCRPWLNPPRRLGGSTSAPAWAARRSAEPVGLGECRRPTGSRSIASNVPDRREQRAEALADRRDVVFDVGDLLLKDVVGDDGRNGDEEADAGRDERLGDAAHDLVHLDLARPLGEVGERHDDADDRAEQADERRVVAERSEQRHARSRGPCGAASSRRRCQRRARRAAPTDQRSERAGRRLRSTGGGRAALRPPRARRAREGR